MPQNTHLQAASDESEQLPEPVHAGQNPRVIHEAAEKLARALTWLPNLPSSPTFVERSHAVGHALKPVFDAVEEPTSELLACDDFRWLYDNSRLLYSDLQAVTIGLKSQTKLPHVRTPNGETIPRVLALAEGFLETVSYEFSEQEFILFVEVFQQTTALNLRELWAVSSALRLVLLEEIAIRGKKLLKSPQENSSNVSVCVRSLRDVGHTNWKDALEPVMSIDRVLDQDPAEAYSRMDFESRQLYRKKVANIAQHSDCSELEVAKAAVKLAEECRHRIYAEPRIALRESHVGFYLVDKGAAASSSESSLSAASRTEDPGPDAQASR